MAGTPLAEAFVRVRALTDKFKDDVEKGFSGLGDQFGKQFAREASARLRQEQTQFRSAGADLGDVAGTAAGEAFGDRMAEQAVESFAARRGDFVSEAEDIGDEAGERGGERFGEAWSESGADAWSKDRSRIIDDAEDLGEDSGEAFTRGFERRASGGSRDLGRRHGKEYGDGFADGLGSGLARVGDVGQRALASLLPALGRLTSGFGSAAGAAGGLLATVGKWTALAGGVSALAAAAASAAGYTVELAAALAPLGGLLAGLPGVALSGAAAFSVWKLATRGLMDAIGAALAYNDEALSAAVSKMSDAGKAFVGEFLKIRNALNEFGDAAQGAFLAPITYELERWLASAQQLQPAIAALAGEMGQMVRVALDFALSGDGVQRLNAILGGTRDLIGAIRSSFEPLLRGFFDLGVVGNQWLASFAPALERMLVTFGQWMSEISRSGQALAWLNDATRVLQQLGRLVRDVWQAFTGLLDAASKAGGNALGVLGQLASAMNQWVNSARGQEQLVTVFRALADIGRAALPVVKSLGEAFALIAPQIARIAQVALPILAKAIDALGPAIAAVGPGLTALISGIGRGIEAIAPALMPLGRILGDSLGALAPLFESIGRAIAGLLPGVQLFVRLLADGLARIDLAPLGAALGGILAAVAPLLPVLGNLVNLIVQHLAAGLQAVTPALGQLVAAFAQGIGTIGPFAGTLAQLGATILNTLMPVLSQLIPVFASLAGPILTALSDALTSVMPSLGLLVKSLGQVVIALAPILPLVAQLAAQIINSLVPALAPLLPQIAELITRLVTGLAPALSPLIPIVGQLAGVIGTTLVQILAVLVDRIVELLPSLSQTAQILGVALLDAVTRLAPYLPQIVDAFLSAIPALVGLLPHLAQLAVALLPQFLAALEDILPLMPDLIRAIIELNQVMLPLIPIVVDLLAQLAPYIPTFLRLAAVIAKELIPPLTDFLRTVSETVGGVIRKFQELYDTLVGHSIIPDLINGIGSWVGRLPAMFTQAIGNAVDAGINEFQQLLSYVGGLGSAILGSLGNMGSLLFNAGRDLVTGFWNGIVSMWNWFVGAVQDLFGSVANWAKSVLGIASPSKVFAAIGRELPPGMVLGIEHNMPMLERASQRMAEATTAAFPADVPATAAPAFAGAFGAPAVGAGVAAAPRVVSVENIILQGVFDPSNPVSYRRTVESLRQAIIDLEQEGYANV
ncbi:hypothetical protein ABZW11_26675 [Nonomuraea sp. NPDC004580]|uniref:phage tail protein n=1 Tax=Nonomuraea sp. NPDC004580 TaxID=3154552 RepID=UPI0033B1E0EF